ncbi:MAG: CPBP family intramembrane metalloprotease [Clostridia bacterium]|nr:CPBP family intramembrane metalloprotease [Clostridia bacterium]
MNSAVKLYTVLVLIFIVLYSLAPAFGILGVALELLAFAIPVAVGFVASRRYKREREEAKGLAEAESTLFGLSGDAALDLLPLVAPAVALIFLISFLTSLLLGALGMTADHVENEELWKMLLLHALMPSLLEEMLFRYLPMKLIAPYSRRTAILISSLFFALIHMSLFQLPYAFFAGLIFILIDLAADSVLPSMIIHFVNNTISVLWIKYAADPGFATCYVVILAALALISLIPIIIRRRRYAALLKDVTAKGEVLTDYSAPLILTALSALLMLGSILV